MTTVPLAGLGASDSVNEVAPMKGDRIVFVADTLAGGFWPYDQNGNQLASEIPVPFISGVATLPSGEW